MMQMVPPLTAKGCRTIVPDVRGYGPTRFLSADRMRSDEQAALGNDLNGRAYTAEDHPDKSEVAPGSEFHLGRI